MKCTNKISVFSLSIILWLTIVYNLYAQGQQISFPKYDPHPNAEQQLKIAIQKAQQENKRILVDVGGEWCIWCHRLDSLFINTPELLKILNEHYVLIKINVSKENKNEEVLSRFPKVDGYPHFFVLDKDGTLLYSQNTGELELPENSPKKGHDVSKVINFLNQWSCKK
ncbi:MAG: thioredoxin family protein [Bacteroidetes bacterium]|nr:thioredoxin family protein [Bacteroidota bacterium]